MEKRKYIVINPDNGTCISKINAEEKNIVFANNWDRALVFDGIAGALVAASVSANMFGGRYECVEQREGGDYV